VNRAGHLAGIITASNLTRMMDRLGLLRSPLRQASITEVANRRGLKGCPPCG